MYHIIEGWEILAADYRIEILLYCCDEREDLAVLIAPYALDAHEVVYLLELGEHMPEDDYRLLQLLSAADLRMLADI